MSVPNCDIVIIEINEETNKINAIIIPPLKNTGYLPP